jgi:hypothetical protein
VLTGLWGCVRMAAEAQRKAAAEVEALQKDLKAVEAEKRAAEKEAQNQEAQNQADQNQAAPQPAPAARNPAPAARASRCLRRRSGPEPQGRADASHEGRSLCGRKLCKRHDEYEW